MNRYSLISEIGNGTYGSVYKAVNKENGDIVAVKRLKRKVHSWKQCINLREIEALRSISLHENVVSIKELIREESSQLFFVFEFMPNGSLFDLMNKQISDRSRGIPNCSLSNSRVALYMLQVLQGLHHIHSHGFFHRDIKPENILMKDGVCKIADFGLARREKVAHSTEITSYISTRWYRAPEILLRDPNYGSGVDIFALGCVMAEMIELRPLFPGTNEIDQIHRITSVLGCPNALVWPQASVLIDRLKISPLFSGQVQVEKSLESFHNKVKVNIEKAVPHATKECITILHKMLNLDPGPRSTAFDLLHDSALKSMVLRRCFDNQQESMQGCKTTSWLLSSPTRVMDAETSFIQRVTPPNIM